MFRIIIYITLILTLTVQLGSLSVAQTGLITLSSTEACEGDIINISVTASDLFNIGAITLFIDYNPNSAEFDTIMNINPQLSALIYNNIYQPPGVYPGGKIGFSWSSFTPVNLSNNVLFEISFVYHGISDSIVFSSGNEIADFDANILNVGLIDAEMSLYEEIFVTNQPEDLNLLDNENGIFTIDGLNINSYNWEYKINNQWETVPANSTFSGQGSNTLTISSPGINYNSTCFRCSLSGCNNIYSDSSFLYVQTNSLNSEEKYIKWSVYPNPASEMINMKIKVKESGYYSIYIFNSLSGVSEIISEDIFLSDESIKSINIQNLSSGIYYLRVLNTLTDERFEFQKKIIIHN